MKELPIPEFLLNLPLEIPYSVSKVWLQREVAKKSHLFLPLEDENEALQRALYCLGFQHGVCNYEEGDPVKLIFYRPGYSEGFKKK